MSLVILLQTDRKRNKINFRLKSILFFFYSLHTTSCMRPNLQRQPKFFPLLLSLNVWRPGIVRASVKLDTKRSGIVMWKPLIAWSARFLMWCWITVMWITDSESTQPGAKIVILTNRKAIKLVWNDLMIGMGCKSPLSLRGHISCWSAAGN